MCTLTSWRRIPPPPPPEKFGAAASRILVGAPARQPDLLRASRKTDGGAAEGSICHDVSLMSQFLEAVWQHILGVVGNVIYCFVENLTSSMKGFENWLRLIEVIVTIGWHVF